MIIKPHPKYQPQKRFSIVIEAQGHTSKPDKNEIPYIKNVMQAGKFQQANTFEFAQCALEYGHTVQGAQLDLTLPNVYSTNKNGNKTVDTNNSFVSQQVFIVDIDNDYKGKDGKKHKCLNALDSPKEIIEICQQYDIHPLLICESFSSGNPDADGKPVNKFHVFFVTDNVVVADEAGTRTGTARKIIAFLIDIFNNRIPKDIYDAEELKKYQVADTACKDPARIIFGTSSDKNIYIYDDENIIPLNVMLFLANTHAAIQKAEIKVAKIESDYRKKQPETNYRSEEMSPEKLLFMIAPNVTYEVWLIISMAYFIAGGNYSDWESWNAGYSDNKPKENARLWRFFENGYIQQITVGTLKFYAQQENPTEYWQYVAELNPQSYNPDGTKKTFPQNKSNNYQNNNQAAGNNQNAPIKYSFVRAIDVPDIPIKYAWFPYLPIGELTIMYARGGTGKSFLTCGIAADISAGRTLPEYGTESSTAEPSNVLFISAEDSQSTLKQRINFACGDLSRCLFIAPPDTKEELEKYQPFELPADKNDVLRIEALKDLLKEAKPKLLIIDPWAAYVGQNTDMNRANSVRAVTAVLNVIAKEFECAILIVAHTNKKLQTENANDAISGSGDLAASSRSTLEIRSFGADSDRRIMVHTKSNHNEKGKSVCYRIINQGRGRTALFQWDGFSDLTEDDLTQAARSGKKLTDIVDEKQDAEENRKIAIDVIKRLAVYGKSINISYDRFREELKNECCENILPSRPTRFMNTLISDLRVCGIGIELKNRLKGILQDGSTDTESRTGFVIHQMDDGYLMASAMPK